MRAKVDEGKAEEAMALFLALPESFRTTRIGMMLRTRVAQGIDDQQYLAAMNEVEKRFPGDPSLSLLLIDANILRMRYPQALEAVDRVDETVGGDPHLDAIRANILVLTGDLEQATVAANRACEREPGLVDNWWSLVTVSLKADTHSRTAELLDHLRQRFAIEFDDLSTILEYARFVASPQHAAWLARQPRPADPSKPAEQRAGERPAPSSP